MTSTQSTLALHLKHAGSSLTAPRQAVFDTLAQAGAMSMQELYTQVPVINRTTIYRIVALFESLGIAQRVAKGWKYKIELTDQFIPHHHHFTCRNCLASISFDEPTILDTMLQDIATHNGFQIDNHTLEIEGLCSNCHASNENQAPITENEMLL